MIHLIYTSTATQPFTRDDLARLLLKARLHNAQAGITGMLLYSNSSFFQVLEGEAEDLEALWSQIAKDPRHTHLTVIIKETIARRSFGDWTMGFASLERQELNGIEGLNDFFGEGVCLNDLDPGRAKKLLSAFKEGRWRSRLTGVLIEGRLERNGTAGEPKPSQHTRPGFSFAFQPIVHPSDGTIMSYEALLRGSMNQPAAEILRQVRAEEKCLFDEKCRAAAIELAVHLGLNCSLNLNFLPLSLETLEESIISTIQSAERLNLHPGRIILEIIESEIIHDLDHFSRIVNLHRRTGLKLAIDDFGAGYAGLNLLADFQPEIVKLDMHLVRDIHRRGPRQAIVRGISRTCRDLGIEIVAEGIETADEYMWLFGEGIEYYQGRFFAGPAFEELPPAFFPTIHD